MGQFVEGEWEIGKDGRRGDIGYVPRHIGEVEDNEKGWEAGAGIRGEWDVGR